MTEKTQGHGYFRKKKWAKGLVSGIAVAGIVAFSAGSVLADEAVQPESKNDNNTYAKQAGKATGSQPVAIDNSAVTKAASTAKQAGVVVSETSSVDKGTDTTSSNLEQSKGEIKQDQDKQIKALEETTAKQVENNTAFKEAQEAIQANNSFVADEKAKHGGETTVTVTNDSSTATDGTATQNKQAASTAKQVLSENKKAVTNYLGEKSKYDATVEQATALNKAVESASEQLKKEKVDVEVVTRTVSSVAEVEALKKQNEQAIVTAKSKVELNKALMAAYTEKKNASDQVNQDADRKSTDLKNSGVLLTSKTQEVSSADEAKQIGKQNQQSYDQAKKAQAEWQKKYNELQSKTKTEGYTKEVVLQALSLAAANPNANVKSSASGAKELTTSYIASSSGNSGYGRILDSTKVLKYRDVGNGWKTEIDYTGLKGLTVSTADGQKHDISRIHRKFEIINQGETGLIDVYVLNDPTEGFVAARNDGIGTSYDYMRFRVTDTYYYNVDGKEVAFNASEKTPATLTYSSLNYNMIGWEGAGAVNGKNVEINGSTVTYHKNDGYNYADDYNTVEKIGLTWDTSDSPYQYKGAALGVFKEGTAFSSDFTQWDNYATTAGQTYWFALNTKVVAPVVEVPATATITKITVKPGKTEPVSAELVKAKNPVKPTLALKTLSETKNQKLSASYHGYKLQYKPVVSKSVADTDKTNTDGQTVAKNATQLYTLHHDNIYANVKKGDKITIIDPLEAGAVPDVAVTKAAAEKAGWGVAYDAGKNTYTFTATYEGKRLEAPVITWKPIYDKGFYDNTYKVLVNNYEVYSNTVTNYTPRPPKPVKSVLDHSGKNINGATTFDRNVTFRLMTDYSPYTKTLASAQALGKKFAILDDVQDKAFTVDHSKIKMTAAGKDVKNLFDMYHVLSDKGRTDAINKILKELNLNPKGEFYLWVAKDSKSFYQNYVKPNKNVTIDLPAKLLVKEGEIVKNDFKQIDFGNSYQSNLVTVEVPNVKPEKHVLDRTGKKVLDGKEVQLGDFVQYLLDGVTVPEKHDTLYQYDGLDKLDTKHDRYTGNWKGIIKGTEYTAEKELVLPYDVTLKNGKVIKAGDKIPKGSSYAFTFEFNQDTNSEFIKKLVTVKWVAKGGQWSYVINQDFLNSLGVKGTFDADFYIEAERIETGDKIENTFINIVNKQEMTAKVITRTPEPPKPTHPEKHALDKTGQKVLDGKEVQLGELIQYLLDGVTVPERHHTLYQYDGLDKLDMKHDRYTGNWKGIIKGTEYTAEKDLTLPYDVILKDGKVIKAGDKIAKGSAYAFTFEFNQDTNSEFIKKLVTVKWDAKGGQWSYVINQDFLKSLGVKGTFDADFYIEVERIAAGEVENTFVNIVNGQEMTAKVTTHTPEPPKPEEPGKPKQSLPNTGTAASMLPTWGMILGLLSLAGAGLRKHKK
ncbi:SspB-related isopeptide-forming adhesin [Streptococcus oralis]|uniref:Glucan-binding protein C n=1 Tax=Streptococcus oralis SK610 TaxID=1095741 RepID=I0Q4T7_STROR|nr:SspB-related isopeptide-forming adhesin [Streptococcus oralis]EIC76289.1 glucan-binding protein C [Streptococcus oralis SK610]